MTIDTVKNTHCTSCRSTFDNLIELHIDAHTIRLCSECRELLEHLIVETYDFDLGVDDE
jgi:hypothetical protein